MVVFVEHGGSGGRVAWPIGKNILETYFTSQKLRGSAPMTRPPVVEGRLAKPLTKPAFLDVQGEHQ
jgi:hypothetical protein